MWPYNEDEAGWLKPRERAEPASQVSAAQVSSARVSANDNDPERRVSRGTSAPGPTLVSKS